HGWPVPTGRGGRRSAAQPDGRRRRAARAHARARGAGTEGAPTTGRQRSQPLTRIGDARPRAAAAPLTATIADVAARAGVSTATVSRVLAGLGQARPETKARVLEAARALDYRPSEVAR